MTRNPKARLTDKQLERLTLGIPYDPDERVAEYPVAWIGKLIAEVEERRQGEQESDKERADLRKMGRFLFDES